MQYPTLVRSTILVLLTTACASARREPVPARRASTEMNVYPAEAIHVSILVPAQEVYDFLMDVNNWKSWAPWVRARFPGRPRRLRPHQAGGRADAPTSRAL